MITNASIFCLIFHNYLLIKGFGLDHYVFESVPIRFQFTSISQASSITFFMWIPDNCSFNKFWVYGINCYIYYVINHLNNCWMVWISYCCKNNVIYDTIYPIVMRSVRFISWVVRVFTCNIYWCIFPWLFLLLWVEEQNDRFVCGWISPLDCFDFKQVVLMIPPDWVIYRMRCCRTWYWH